MAKKFWEEFKNFAIKGNVIDLAVGVIIGGAFGKIVTSLVNDLLMPVIGVLVGGIDFSDLQFKIGEATIRYGAFIQTVVDFLIISFSIFLFVRFLNKLKLEHEKQAEVEEAKTPPPPPPPSKEEILLTDIKNILEEIKDKKSWKSQLLGSVQVISIKSLHMNKVVILCKKSIH